MSTGGSTTDLAGAIGGAFIASLLGGGASLVWVRLRDTVYCSLKLQLCWIADKVFLFVLAPVQFVMDLVPDFPENWTITGGEVLYCLNIWFPMAEGLALEIVIWSVYLAWVVFRLVKMFFWGASN